MEKNKGKNRLSAKARSEAGFKAAEEKRINAKKWETYHEPSIFFNPKCPMNPEEEEKAETLFHELELKGIKIRHKQIAWLRLFATAQKAYLLGDWNVRYSRYPAREIYLQVIGAAVEKELFEEQRTPQGGKHMSRLIATPKLKKHFSERPLVIVREKETKKPVDDGRDYSDVEEKLRRINTINARSRIEALHGVLDGREGIVLDAWHTPSSTQGANTDAFTRAGGANNGLMRWRGAQLPSMARNAWKSTIRPSTRECSITCTDRGPPRTPIGSGGRNQKTRIEKK